MLFLGSNHFSFSIYAAAETACGSGGINFLHPISQEKYYRKTFCYEKYLVVYHNYLNTYLPKY